MLLDGDGVWILRKIAIQVAWMVTHLSYWFCKARCWKVDESGNDLQVCHEAGLLLSRACRPALAERMWVCTRTMAFWRAVYEKVEAFNKSRIWVGEEESKYSWRCAKMTEFRTIQEPLGQYRVSRNNWTSKKWRGVKRNYLALSHIYDRPDLSRGVKNRREMRRLLAEISVERYQYWRARGDFAKAGWFAPQALRRALFVLIARRQVADIVLKWR